MSRLRLDWTIPSAEERLNFINKYLDTLKFTPSDDELEMIGNYLLWGKDKDGLNGEERGDYEIESKSKTWTSSSAASLDELNETSLTGEVRVHSLRSNAAIPRIPKRKLDRNELLRDAPSELQEVFSGLFERIDRLDLELNFYDLAHGKRKNPPREELLRRFAPEEIEELQHSAETISPAIYWKKRHLLVELRREQYTLKDSYAPQILLHKNGEENVDIEEEDSPLSFGANAEVDVFPLGTKNSTFMGRLVFREDLAPNFSEQELEKISEFIWERKNSLQKISTLDVEGDGPYFSFMDAGHIYQLALNYLDLEDAAATPGDLQVFSTTKDILRTFDWYRDMAGLDEIQLEILQEKIHHKKNEDIAAAINQRYRKSYGANYISTIFTKQICARIAAAAVTHFQQIQEIFFPENWKKCKTCGRLLLINENNFMHNKKSKDGFASRCKQCDKVKRKERKEAISTK